MSTETVRIFIGSGEASRLERKVLIHSLRKNSRSLLDIHVFNGTHNAIERNDEQPVAAPLSLRAKYRSVTEFSNYRFLIPQLCGYQGRAIWIDSDTISLVDIAQLFRTPMNGADLLAKADAYHGGGWALSVMLIDCARCRFDIERYFDEVDRGLYSPVDFHQMTPRFRAHHPFTIGQLDPGWNSFDVAGPDTKLIHYTNLLTQPWKFPGHPHGELWFRNFRDALASGTVSHEDIELSKLRAYVRQDIMDGNGAAPTQRFAYLRRAKNRIKRLRAQLAARRAAI